MEEDSESGYVTWDHPIVFWILQNHSRPLSTFLNDRDISRSLDCGLSSKAMVDFGTQRCHMCSTAQPETKGPCPSCSAGRKMRGSGDFKFLRPAESVGRKCCISKDSVDAFYPTSHKMRPEGVRKMRAKKAKIFPFSFKQCIGSH